MSLPSLYQSYIHLSRYSRWLPEKNRRETWDETVARYFNFFEVYLKEYGFVLEAKLRKELEDAVLNLDIMPSMRCLMTAGPALQRDATCAYNCSYVAVDNPKSFDEIMFILLNGTGVGFSVERQYINKLPNVADELYESDTTIMVADSKIGWAKSLKELISLLYSGQIPKWDTTKVRDAGTPLKTFGGRASGPEPLEDLFRFTIQIFKNAAGRKLTSLECHDLICKIGDAIVSGGVRRSALISLSNLSDDRMRGAKSGQWWENFSYRGLANNSAVYDDRQPDMSMFMTEWHSLYDSKSGERGIFSRYASQKQVERANEFRRLNFQKDNRIRYRENNHDFGCNPCSEIILRDKEFCNLTEVIVRHDDTIQDLKRKVRLASILGTFQSTLTHFRYLSTKWFQNTEDERLLGVSLTGIMDNDLTNGKGDHDSLKKILEDLKKDVIKTNLDYAEKLKIPSSVATTCIKPSGCTTLETKIKTKDGIMSMAEIFAKYSDNNIFEQNPNTWLQLNNDLHVYDENNELQQVTKLYINGISNVYEIEDENGDIYKFTGNHKLKTKDGWKRVDELNEDDEIITF